MRLLWRDCQGELDHCRAGEFEAPALLRVDAKYESEPVSELLSVLEAGSVAWGNAKGPN